MPSLDLVIIGCVFVGGGGCGKLEVVREGFGEDRTGEYGSIVLEAEDGSGVV